jgi:hypothetical protein
VLPTSFLRIPKTHNRTSGTLEFINAEASCKGMGKDAVKSFTSLFIKLDRRWHKAMFKLFLEGAENVLAPFKRF